MQSSNFFAAVLGSAALAAAPMAARAYDVGPSKNGANKIITNAFEDDTETQTANVRVFPYSFGEDPALPANFLEDPGFHPVPDPVAGLPIVSTPLSVAAFSGLKFWNGSGNVAFSSVTGATKINVTRGSQAGVDIGATAPSSSATLSIATTDATGEFDEHIDSTISDGACTVADGIYLFNLNVRGSGLTDSDPLFLLFNFGASDAALDRATVYARDTFAPGSNLVPEPAGMAMLGAGLAVIGRRRRRA